MTRPRILVVSLGGTITMTRSEAGGVVPTLSADDLVAAAPGLAEVAEIETASPSRTPGASLALPDLSALARELGRRLEGDVAGAVVVQGTDTIEETAFLLDLLVDSDRPVVVVGAMRGPQAPGADGPANLLDAVTVAAAEDARSLGAVAVLNGEVHAARFVRKMHTERPSAFASPSAGPLGVVSEGRLRIFSRPPAGPRIALPEGAMPAQVSLVTTALGDDGEVLKAAGALPHAGLVLEGLGGGHVPAPLAATVGEIAARKALVLSTRVPGGRVMHETYGFPGSEIDLIARGAIPSGHLGAAKARILLSLALGAGHDRAGIAGLLARYD